MAGRIPERAGDRLRIGHSESVTGEALPRSVAVAILLAALAVTAFAPGALASHGAAIVDCGADGTYTLKDTETGNGSWQAPGPGDLLLLEEGVLKPLELWVDGSLRFSNAATGRENNASTEAQCTFTIGTGQTFYLEEILVTSQAAIHQG